MSLLPECDNVVLANILVIIYWDEIFAWSPACNPFNTLLKGVSSLQAYLFFTLNCAVTQKPAYINLQLFFELEAEYRFMTCAYKKMQK